MLGRSYRYCGIRQKSKSKWIVESTFPVNFEDMNIDPELSYEYRSWTIAFETNTCNLWEKYNFFTGTQWRVHVLKGWEKAEIESAVAGREELPPVDPHQDMWRMTRESVIKRRRFSPFRVCTKEFSVFFFLNSVLL